MFWQYKIYDADEFWVKKIFLRLFNIQNFFQESSKNLFLAINSIQETSQKPFFADETSALPAVFGNFLPILKLTTLS